MVLLSSVLSAQQHKISLYHSNIYGVSRRRAEGSKATESWQPAVHEVCVCVWYVAGWEPPLPFLSIVVTTCTATLSSVSARIQQLRVHAERAWIVQFSTHTSNVLLFLCYPRSISPEITRSLTPSNIDIVNKKENELI